MADQGEIFHAGRGRVGNKPESVAIRESRHRSPRRCSRHCNFGGGLEERATHFVRRLVCGLSREYPAPIDFERVDDPFHLIHCAIHSHDAVWYCERIVHAHVLHMKRSGSFIQIHFSAFARNLNSPEDVSCRQATVPRMRAQRARKAVESNKSEGPFPLDPIRSHKHSMHEAHVSVEYVGSGLPRRQVSSSSGQVEIPLADEPFEVENDRRIPSLGMRTTRI